MFIRCGVAIGASLMLTATAYAKETYLICTHQTEAAVPLAQLYLVPPKDKAVVINDIVEAGVVWWIIPPNGVWTLDEAARTVAMPNGLKFENAAFSKVSIWGSARTESGNELQLSIDRITGKLRYTFHHRDGSREDWKRRHGRMPPEVVTWDGTCKAGQPAF